MKDLDEIFDTPIKTAQTSDEATMLKLIKSQVEQLISNEVEKAARLAWNISAEGWNAQYAGIHRNVEEGIVQDVLDTLNGVKNKSQEDK